MVVWRFHGTEPPAEHLDAHARPSWAGWPGTTLTVEHYVDDNMRNIPDHYHAHARPKGGFFGHGIAADRDVAQHPPRPRSPVRRHSRSRGSTDRDRRRDCAGTVVLSEQSLQHREP